MVKMFQRESDSNMKVFYRISAFLHLTEELLNKYKFKQFIFFPWVLRVFSPFFWVSGKNFGKFSSSFLPRVFLSFTRKFFWIFEEISDSFFKGFLIFWREFFKISNEFSREFFWGFNETVISFWQDFFFVFDGIYGEALSKNSDKLLTRVLQRFF